MDSKEQLKKKFSKDYKKYYQVELFREKGFRRYQCIKCSKHFWSLVERKTCPDSTCQKYEFIGKRTKNTDYIATWKTIEKFFVKKKHKSIGSYPVVCRWFPGLYYTVASIVAFQRSVAGKTVFEFPANPLIIPQQCLRFNDIPNVGVTGRHNTNFIMIGQHSLYDGVNGYWKDVCVDLDFQLLTKALGIKPEEIAFMEDVWLGPNAFGYSLEYFVKGLELGNAVFTEFLGTPENYAQMDSKVVDMGAGLERFTWLLNGTPTCYDAIFGPLMSELKKKTDYDKEFFEKYAIIAGSLELDGVADQRLAKKHIASQLNVSIDALQEKTGPVEAVYAIADHSRTLLYSVTDGLLPSNVGGGYNLRIVLRRALSFISQYKIDTDLYELCTKHAKYLAKLKPEAKESLGELEDILTVEKERFKSMKKRGRALIENILEKNIELDNKQLGELYESHGITPELIAEVSEELGIHAKLRPDFYTALSEKHMKEKEKKEFIDVSDLPKTALLFYDDHDMSEFTAKALKIMDNKYVVLDKTAFYGRAGGQEPDTGFINGCRVYDAEKIAGVIVHAVENISFKEGDVVTGVVDWERRQQIAVHHTAVHVVNGAARHVLGNHIWQAGAHKNEKRAHIDITHYKPLSAQEIEKIEEVANSVVKRALKVKKQVMSRQKAEELYGMKIYQGGAIPEKELRINSIQDKNGKIFDVEACSGTHLDNIKLLSNVVITSAERIQDGVVRLTLVAGPAAMLYIEEKKRTIAQLKRILATDEEHLVVAAKQLFENWKNSMKSREKQMDEQSLKLAGELENKVVRNVLIEKTVGDRELLQKTSKLLSRKDRIIVLFGVGEKIVVFCSVGESTGADAGEITRKTCEKLGGRGGGTKALGQGIGSDKSKLDETMKTLWKELIP